MYKVERKYNNYMWRLKACDFQGFSSLNMNQALDQEACIQMPPPLKRMPGRETSVEHN